MQHNNISVHECIERIEKWFLSDTFIFLDEVLTDDENDPEYSANTAYSRLQYIVDYHRLYLGDNVRDVEDFLLKNRYSKEDVDLLKQKCREETARYQGT